MVSKPPSRGYAEAWLVESRTDPTAKYTVSKRPDGTFACSCPAWKFHPAPKVDCKHIDGVREALNEDSTRAAVEDIQRYQRERRERGITIAVSFDGVLIGHITEVQAEQFKANMRLAGGPKPPQPTPLTTTFGDFTIRRKFRLGGTE